VQLTPHFSFSEFLCPCCGNGNPVTAQRVAEELEKVRPAVGPIIIHSGFRCQKQNKKVGGVDHSYHLLGLAADIAVNSDSRRYALVRALLDSGWKRLGIAYNYVHADLGPTRTPVIWTYY